MPPVAVIRNQPKLMIDPPPSASSDRRQPAEAKTYSEDSRQGVVSIDDTDRMAIVARGY
jgi:hypothetical protein